MAKKKSANVELNEVLPAIGSPADDFDETDGTGDEAGEQLATTPVASTSESPETNRLPPLNQLVVERLQGEIETLKAEVNYVRRCNDRLQGELNAKSGSPQQHSGSPAWYFDASQNTTAIAVPVAVIYAPTQSEALKKFLSLSGVSGLAVSPVCEIASEAQIAQFAKPE